MSTDLNPQDTRPSAVEVEFLCKFGIQGWDMNYLEPAQDDPYSGLASSVCGKQTRAGVHIYLSQVASWGSLAHERRDWTKAFHPQIQPCQKTAVWASPCCLMKT